MTRMMEVVVTMKNPSMMKKAKKSKLEFEIR